jgi:hypothetical protein
LTVTHSSLEKADAVCSPHRSTRGELRSESRERP